VARVLHLTDVLELIDDRLDERSFSQQQLVHQAQQARLHLLLLLLRLGDQLDALREKQIEESLRDVASIGEHLAEQGLAQVRNGCAIIDLSARECEVEQVPFVIDDEMQLEAKEPAGARLATLCDAGEDTRLLDARVVADRQVGRVEEGNAAAPAGSAEGTQVAQQRHEHGGNAFDEAAIADQRGELAMPVYS